MNWLTNFVRPKIRALVSAQKDVPDNLWQKCPSCGGMLFSSDLEKAQNVCTHCGFHMAMPVLKRLEALFDEGKFKRIETPKVPHDPLKFRDRKRYADRLKESQSKTGEKDAIVVAEGKIGGMPAVIAAFNFAFMGGSMGTAVGEGIVKAAEHAVNKKAGLIVIPASGGARMQEGALSLMQMPRTIVAVDRVKQAKLTYIVLLTNPTTGGVSASFAMVGDIHIAEPGATIGFAGKRVIQETIREDLPEGFQTAEYLYEHGMVDRVVERKKLAKELGSILSMLMKKPAPSASESGNGNGKKEKGKSQNKKSGSTAKSGQAEPQAAHAQSNNVVKLARTNESNTQSAAVTKRASSS